MSYYCVLTSRCCILSVTLPGKCLRVLIKLTTQQTTLFQLFAIPKEIYDLYLAIGELYALKSNDGLDNIITLGHGMETILTDKRIATLKICSRF